MALRSRIADEQTASLGGWLFADLFLLIMVIGLAGFTILPSKGGPNATTGQAKEVTFSSALVMGIVDAGDAEAAVSIRWGTSSTLTGDAQVSNAIGSPVAAKVLGADVSAQFDGQKPDTKYYFQVQAKSSVGSGSGEIRSFQTPQEGCSNAPSFIKEPFEKRYSAKSARSNLLADLNQWAAQKGFVQPKVAVALIRGWTDNPAGNSGSSNARRFFNEVILTSDPVHFDVNTALDSLQNQYLGRGEFDVRLFFVEDAEKCSS